LVTDNGPSFIARKFDRFIEDLYRHVRIQYRTPTQLGLLERFHRTLKTEANHSYYTSKDTFSQPHDSTYSGRGSLVTSGALAPATSYHC
jgi:transposase InsO family protein